MQRRRVRSGDWRLSTCRSAPVRSTQATTRAVPAPIRRDQRAHPGPQPRELVVAHLALVGGDLGLRSLRYSGHGVSAHAAHQELHELRLLEQAVHGDVLGGAEHEHLSPGNVRTTG